MKRNLIASIAGLMLMLGAASASAVPLGVQVNTLTAGGSTGSWSLSGPTAGGGAWAHALIDSSNWGLNIADGSYTFSIGGVGFGIGLVNWNLSLAGSTFYSESAGVFIVSKFGDRTTFEAAAVPEPSSLALIGAGLLGLGFLRRRRTV